MVNLQNANAMVNVSKGFENKVNNSNLLSINEKEQIVTEITTKKYIVAYVENNSATTGGSQPLNGPRFWLWLGGVILSSILWTISML